MKEIDKKIILPDLTVGSRIAYIRKLRGMTQQELGDAIGLETKTARNIICRYERTGRVPRDEILIRIAKALDVSLRMISEYEFNNVYDLYCLLVWNEEICPETFDIGPGGIPGNCELARIFRPVMLVWKNQRKALRNGDITWMEYFNWKMGAFDDQDL